MINYFSCRIVEISKVAVSPKRKNMPFETWLTYTFITTTFLLIPGPTLLLVISYSLSRGRSAVMALVVGVGLGDLTAMILSFLGVETFRHSV